MVRPLRKIVEGTPTFGRRRGPQILPGWAVCGDAKEVGSRLRHLAHGPYPGIVHAVHLREQWDKPFRAYLVAGWKAHRVWRRRRWHVRKRPERDGRGTGA